MGSCVSGQKHPPNFFFVKNINEDKHLVQKGLLEVSETELIYTDNASADRWTWPLKYLRKYGCDGEVFSFEAGRKCPGGEGLYAFSSKRASKIFEIVARNINHGEQQVPNGEISPFPSETRPPDTAIMSFVRQQSPPPAPVVAPPTTAAESNYTNIGQDGLPLVQPEPPAPLPPKGQYLPVVFQKPPQEHPVPERNPDNPPTSYSQIDFEKTDQLSRERLQGTLLQNSNPHRTSGSVSLPPSQQQRHRHRRLNTVSSGASQTHRRSSESSFSSQSSLTESSRNLTSPQVNGHISHPAAIGEEPTGATYQNVLLAQQQVLGSPQTPQTPGLYQNVNVGQGNVGEVFNTSESRYANMEYPTRHHTMTANGNGTVTPHKVNGMGTYADVQIDPNFRNRATSTPVGQDSSYLQLDFQKDQTGKSDSVAGLPDHSSLVPQPSLSSNPRTPDVSAIKPPREERAASTSDIHVGSGKGLEVIDENRVTYGTLNFPAMAALSETSRARELEISENHHDISERLEKESRERKTSTSHLKGFKKSHKEK